MKLSQMQDLGGCRAVLSTMRAVKRLVLQYKAHVGKSSNSRSYIDSVDDYDYILRPKPDGYRSVHFIVRYQTPSKELAVFNGQRIEIQIRTRLQHAWATAVETAQLFTGQALKSKVKHASDEWLRFFALSSGAFAVRENCPPVPGVSPDRNALLAELRDIADKLRVFDILPGWSASLRITQKRFKNANIFVLRLSTKEHRLFIHSYRAHEWAEAQERYDNLEKESERNPSINVVLVRVEDMKALRRAYPNYHVDTVNFLQSIAKELRSRQ